MHGGDLACLEIEVYLFFGQGLPGGDVHDFDGGFAGNGQLVEGVIDRETTDVGVEDLFGTDLVPDLLDVGRDVAQVALAERQHQVPVSELLVVRHLPVLLLEKQFQRLLLALQLVQQKRLAHQNPDYCPVATHSLLTLLSSPTHHPRLLVQTHTLAFVLATMQAYCQNLVLSYKYIYIYIHKIYIV